MPEFTYRRMAQKDKPEILKISSKIWEGNDFLPSCFDGWVKDKRGEFTAILHDGSLIGCCKMTFFTPTDVWFQGLRKDIDLEIKGVTEAVTRYYLRKLKAYENLTSVRFSAYFREPASVKAAEKCGFRKQRSFSLKNVEFDPEKIVKPDQSNRTCVITDTRKILKYIRKSGYFDFMEGDICYDWEVRPYSEALIKKDFIKKEKCYGIIENNEIKALGLVYMSRGLSLSFLDADDISYASELLEYLKYPSLDSMWKTVMIVIPENPKLKALIDALGFKSWEQENDYLLFEFPVENLKSFK
jgi:RimJ/RimL family protein N-acetyltransferase